MIVLISPIVNNSLLEAPNIKLVGMIGAVFWKVRLGDSINNVIESIQGVAFMPRRITSEHFNHSSSNAPI